LIHFYKRFIRNSRMPNIEYKHQELVTLTKQFASLEVRETVGKEIIMNIIDTLKSEFLKEPVNYLLVIECLRCLRNSVAGVKSNQEIVIAELDREFDFWYILNDLMHNVDVGESNYLTSLRCCLQLVGNLLVGQTDYQRKIFSSLTNTLEKLFTEIKDPKCLNFACMILLTLQKNSDDLKVNVDDYQKKLSVFIPRILILVEQEVTSSNSDFAQLSFGSFMDNPEYLTYLPSKQRVSLVPYLSLPVPLPIITLLSTDFTFLTDILLTTNMGSVTQLDPSSILALTELLADCSGQEQYRTNLQGHKSLVLNTLYLLKMVHEAGKSGAESLKVLGKLRDVEKRESGDRDDITASPTFGFKENLIQLLTNLVWDNTANKTTVGELDGLALILDCSQMDARNPLITQRVVLAVRALTNNHLMNQEMLAGLKKIGAADGDLLKELGMERDQEGKIKKMAV